MLRSSARSFRDLGPFHVLTGQLTLDWKRGNGRLFVAAPSYGQELALAIGFRSLEMFMGRDAASHIVGAWQNQLGSRVELITQKTGELTGTFVPAVGAPIGPHLLVGFYDDSPADGSCTLGFVVRWPEEHSVSAWSGRYESGRDVIVATWLLSAAIPQDAWRATSIGCDEFRRL